MSKKFIIPPLRCQILFFEGETRRSRRCNKITIPPHTCNAAHRSLPALLLTTQLQASAISNSANLRCESLSTSGGFPRKKPKQWWEQNPVQGFLILWDKKTNPETDSKHLIPNSFSFFPPGRIDFDDWNDPKTSFRSLKGAFPVGGKWWNHRWGLDLGYFWILRTYLNPQIHLLAVCFFFTPSEMLKWKKSKLPQDGCLKDDSSGHDSSGHDWCHDFQGCIMMKRKQDFQADWHMW